MNPKMEQELVRGALQGFRQSYEQLLSFLAPVAFRYFCSHWKFREEDADDLCQEALLQCWKYLHSYKKKSRLKTWFLGICRRIGFNFSQQKKHTLTLDLAEKVEVDVDVDCPTPEDLLIVTDEYSKFQSLLDDLSPTYREVIHLYYIEGMPPKEIAKLLKCPVNTVKTNRARAIDRLRALWLRRFKKKK